MIDRRGFVRITLAVLLLAPLGIHAQPGPRIRRIGLLSQRSGPTNEEFQSLVVPLRELGWIEGKNIVIESRFAKGKLEALSPLADELVGLGVDLIVTYGTPAALAAKNATTSIPIVMGSVGDPVAMGIVASLARPDGNITGYSIVSPEMAVKRAGLVHELLPAARRVAVIVTQKGLNSIADLLRKQTDAAYRSLGLEPIFIEVLAVIPDSVAVEAVREAVRQKAQVLELPNGRFDAMTEAAIGYRLPVIIVGSREMVEAGGLLSIDENEEDRGRRVAAIIDKIFRGAKPGELPIEQPTRFTLIVNLKTAKALGISVPQSLLLRADEVIQ
jgi:putative ABC transport system substrate-binding protein